MNKNFWHIAYTKELFYRKVQKAKTYLIIVEFRLLFSNEKYGNRFGHILSMPVYAKSKFYRYYLIIYMENWLATRRNGKKLGKKFSPRRRAPLHKELERSGATL